MRFYISDTAIEFIDEENRIEGVTEFMRYRFGFSNALTKDGKNRYFVPKEVLKHLNKKKIKYTVLSRKLNAKST